MVKFISKFNKNNLANFLTFFYLFIKKKTTIIQLQLNAYRTMLKLYFLNTKLLKITSFHDVLALLN